MFNFKRFSTLLCVLLAMLLGMTACTVPSGTPTTAPTQAATAVSATGASDPTSSPEPEVIDPMAKYDPPIELSTVISLDAARKYPADQSWDDNVWTRAYYDKMGIRLTYLWTVDTKQYENKLNIAIAADDLPDIMKIPYKFFYKLAASGKLADLTQVYDEYASEDVKTFFAQASGYAIRNCTINGCLYGLSSPTNVADNFQLLYIRDDWMKALNLSAPQNAEDVINIALAFAQQDPDGDGVSNTIGLGMDNTIFEGGMSLAGFFNMYGAYPDIWIEKDGELVFGSIQPEMKEGLSKLAELYAAGAIDRDFSIKGPWDEASADGSAGRIGMAFGVSWFQFWYPVDLAGEAQDFSTYYESYIIPAADGSAAMTTGTASLGSVTCVSPGCEYPEAAVKLSNLATYLTSTEGGRAEDYIYNKIAETDADGEKITIETHFFNYLGMAFGELESGLAYGRRVAQAIETGDTSKLEGTGDYDEALAYLAGEKWGAYGAYYTYGPNQSYIKVLSIYEQGLYVLDKFSGPQTETMITNLPNLLSKEVEIITQIIMGAKSIDEFDTWVTYFNQQGGAQITQEVNEWYAPFRDN